MKVQIDVFRHSVIGQPHNEVVNGVFGETQSVF